VWHPTRPIIASISNAGVVYIWASNYTENWSAFAPDFKELEENEDYIEKEYEFDIGIEEITKRRKYSELDEEVDIQTVDPISQLSSEEEDELLFIPCEIPPDFNLQLHPPPPNLMEQTPLFEKETLIQKENTITETL